MLRQILSKRATNALWVLTPKSFYSATAPAMHAQQQEKYTVDLETLFTMRDLMRDAVREKCLNLSRVEELSKEEIARELESIEQHVNAMRLRCEMKHPFADAIQFCLQENLPITSELYERFRRSDEFGALLESSNGFRGFLFLPGTKLLVKQLKTQAAPKDIRVELVSSFLGDYLNYSAIVGPVVELINHLALKEDCTFLTSVLESLDKKGSRFAAYLATNLVCELLSVDNQMDRLKELMQSKIKTDKDVRIFVNRVVNQLIRKLKSIKSDTSSSDLPVIAQVISAGFQHGENDTTGGNAIAMILGATGLDDNVLERLIDYLMEDPRVQISRTEIGRIETQLRDANLPSRAKMIYRLKRKTSAHSRWMQTESMAELIKEAKSLEAKDVNPGVLCALYHLILRKAISVKPIDMDVLLWLLPNFQAVEKKLPINEAKAYRAEIYQALNSTLMQTIVQRNGMNADKLWELEPSRYHSSDQSLIYAMSLCERGEQQKASDVLVSLKESGYVVDERTLKDVTKSGYLRSLTSEEAINKFLSLFAEHFTITNNQRHHLVDLVQSNALRTLINENKLVDANDMIARLGDVIFRDIQTSFVLIDLLKVAIKASDTVSFNKTKNFIQARRDLNTAINYIGIAFLELNDERWRKMLSKIGHIPSDLLWSITLREVKLHRADVLHTLFNVFNKPENSSVDLEMLLGEIYKLYDVEENLIGLRTLYEEVRSSQFILPGKLKVKIEASIKKLEHQGHSTTNSSSPLSQMENSPAK